MVRGIINAILTIAFLAVHLSCVHGQSVNVKNFGAKGDGKRNDTQAILKAFDQVKQKGGTIFFPAGTYLSDVIDIRPSKGVSIRIEGVQGKSRLIKNPDDKQSVALFFCEVPGVSLTFQNLLLEGSSSESRNRWQKFKNSDTYDIQAPIRGIYGYNLKDLTVVNCKVQNFHGDAISAYSSQSVHVSRTTIKNVNGTSIKGHRVERMEVINNHIENTGYLPAEFTVGKERKNRASFFPTTTFGDGIEGDCNVLIAKENTIINPGRCGIVHDLAADLGYRNSSAEVSGNTIMMKSASIHNGNPPAGMWFEQSANVTVQNNQIGILQSRSQIVTGIRFYAVNNSIVCKNNTINATGYKHSLENGIGVFEPKARDVTIEDNTLRGKMKVGIAVSYQQKQSGIDSLIVRRNRTRGISGKAVQLYTGQGIKGPKYQTISNN